MTKVFKRAILAAATAGLGLSGAQAAVVYDLRIVAGPSGPIHPSQSKQIFAVPGAYTVKLYGRVDGTNGNNLDDGLGSGFVSILSSEGGVGALADGWGIAGPAVLASSWAGTGSNPGGPPADVNGDGILDLGTAISNNTASNQAPPRVAWRTTEGSGRGFLNTPGLVGGTAVNASTAEFELASFTVNVVGPVTSLDPLGDSTTFTPVVPTNLAIGTNAVAATVDNVTFNVGKTGTATPGQSAATPASAGVTFHIIPEPSSLSLFGLASLGLLRRRRRERREA